MSNAPGSLGDNLAKPYGLETARVLQPAVSARRAHRCTAADKGEDGDRPRLPTGDR